MQPVAFAYAKLPAQDVERARRFYADTLDLHPFGETEGHLYYDVNGCRFMLFGSTGTASGTHDQLGFVVDDIEAWVDHLRTAGVAVKDYPMTKDGVADFGHVRAAWFNDTEGNLVNLIEGTTPLWSD